MAIITGTTLKNKIKGTALADSISGLGGNDFLLGLAGNDKLYGGDGNDQLDGGKGNDKLYGGKGNDILGGGLGADKMFGGTGNDTFLVDNAADTVSDTSGVDDVRSSITYTLGAGLENLTLMGAANINGTGNALDNVITGNAGNNILDGGAGADTLLGGAGNDIYIIDNAGKIIGDSSGIDEVRASINYNLVGGVENLTLTGSANLNGTGDGGDNVITGNSGNNVLDGRAGADHMFGGDGNDKFLPGADLAADVINGGNGNDTVGYETATQAVGVNLFTNTGSLGALNDSYISIENVTGSDHDDIITGNTGSNILQGGAGNDTFFNGAFNASSNAGLDGSDVFDGGAGTGDTVSYADQVFGRSADVDFLDSTKTNGAAFGDTFIGIENIIGSASTETISGDDNANILDGGDFLGQDTLNGRGGADILIGRDGPDILNGGIGDDTLIGGAGADQMTGGGGIDMFEYFFQAEGGDTITDFDTTLDVIAVQTPTSLHGTGDFFSPLGHAVGAINANELVHGLVSDQPFAQFIIALNGDLFYDADGTGGASAQVLIAHLTGINEANFTNADIIVL